MDGETRKIFLSYLAREDKKGRTSVTTAAIMKDLGWTAETVNRTISSAQTNEEVVVDQVDRTVRLHDRLRSQIDPLPDGFTPFSPDVGQAQVRNPWISGSFYLAAVVIIITLFLVSARTVHILALPVIIVAAILAVSIIGAYQLRQDRSLSEENFLRLMLLVFRQLPFLRSKKNNRDIDSGEGRRQIRHNKR